MELQCTVQNYEWGKVGRDSMVAKLISSADTNITIEDKPYAELWIGTHPNGPSLIIERGVLLADYIKDNLDAIGPVVRNKFGVAVPFLLKVLSIRKALSIQAHPNKAHAEELHQQFPEVYRDPNHKPELAIALTPFEALCGFRDVAQIKAFLNKLPELCEILPKAVVDSMLSEIEGDSSTAALKQLFASLMTSDKAAIASSLQKLVSRLEHEDDETKAYLQYSLLNRLHKDFPGDVGCYAPYLLNYLQLKQGEAIFLGPNLPHAYLSGDCIECMSCSDNVVRAGLTPKPLDVPTLLGMLDYGSYSREQLLFMPKLEDENSCVWRPPVPDFAVVKIKVQSDDSYNTANRPSPSLIIITAGEGTACDTEPIPCKPGVAIFLKASRQLTLTPAPGKTLEAFQAICNV
ncbi:mannose-6-phosphate isomerase [Plutella xylostella]|uniref:mannose-6-phosphate isomerase n=1 Tax=Plutella xylostella TaxID=51655 RepID=UPI002032B4B6|nr:mannose-6-phosphate isomerase [Plutella xylostella]XP_011553501.3 mannose-6-phosphate isomerase [Plutella xylostella]